MTTKKTKGGPKALPKAPRTNNRYVKKKRVLRKGFEGRGSQGGAGKARTQYTEIPGYATWVSDRVKELEAVNPVKNHKSRFGIPNGMIRAESDEAWTEARALAAKDIQRMKDAGILTEADGQAEEAMRATLEVMRGPMDQKMKLAAARQVLEWTKAKPASSSNVTVNTAEDWLDSLNPKD